MRLGKFATTLLLLIMTSSVLFQATAIAGARAPSSCILLVEASSSFLGEYADSLHALIDLLPTDLELGLGLLGQSAGLQPPQTLTRLRRAELHASIEHARSATELPPMNNFAADISAAISLLASKGQHKNTLIVLRSGAPLPDSWQDLSKAAIEWGILLLDIDLTAPQVRQTSVQELQRPDEGALASLPELLGLAAADPQDLAYDTAGLKFGVTLPPGVRSLIVQWDRSKIQQVFVTTPSGERVDLLAAELQEQFFLGPSYVCVHLDAKVLPSLLDWEGQWQISAIGSSGLGVWFKDPAWLQATVHQSQGQRVISATTQLWQSGQEGEVPVTIKLFDWRGTHLVELNDLGLNGDNIAGDDIYSAILPDFIGAGPAKLQISGAADRQLLVMLPAPSQLAPPLQVADSKPAKAKHYFIALGLILSTSICGLIVTRKKTPVVWRISHRAADGYWHGYDMTSKAVLLGSSDSCQIRLARKIAGQQWRVRLTRQNELMLDILSTSKITTVNDSPVYIGKHLQHGDRIQIEGDTVLVERLQYLRAGRQAG